MGTLLTKQNIFTPENGTVIDSAIMEGVEPLIDPPPYNYTHFTRILYSKPGCDNMDYTREKIYFTWECDNSDDNKTSRKYIFNLDEYGPDRYSYQLPDCQGEYEKH